MHKDGFNKNLTNEREILREIYGYNTPNKESESHLNATSFTPNKQCIIPIANYMYVLYP